MFPLPLRAMFSLLHGQMILAAQLETKTPPLPPLLYTNTNPSKVRFIIQQSFKCVALFINYFLLPLPHLCFSEISENTAICSRYISVNNKFNLWCFACVCTCQCHATLTTETYFTVNWQENCSDGFLCYCPDLSHSLKAVCKKSWFLGCEWWKLRRWGLMEVRLQ